MRMGTRLAQVVTLGVVSGVLCGACGSGGMTTHKVVRIGGGRVEIPRDTPENVFAVTRAVLAKTGYEPWYAHCILGQMEKVLTLAEATALAKEKTVASKEREFDLYVESSENCAHPGRAVINPRATAAELRPIREQTASSFRSAFERDPEATAAEVACVGRRIEGLTGDEIIEMSNSGAKRQEQLVGELFLPCFPSEGEVPEVAGTESTDGASSVNFEMPSGNIVCALSSEHVACEIFKKTYTPYIPKPAACPMDYGKRLSVGEYGPAEFDCYGDSMSGIAEGVLPYGREIRRGGIRCVSRESGLTCKDRVGAGFFLSVQRAQLY